MVSATSSGLPPCDRLLVRRNTSRWTNGMRAVIAVSMNPGATALTVIPRSARSGAIAADQPRDARLGRGVVCLALVAGEPEVDAMPTMRPPSSSPPFVPLASRTSLMRICAARFTSRTEAHLSASVLTSILSLVIPALWTMP